MSGIFNSVSQFSTIIYIGFACIVAFIVVSWIIKKIAVMISEKSRISGRIRRIGEIDDIKASGGRKKRY